MNKSINEISVNTNSGINCGTQFKTQTWKYNY